MQVVYSGLFKRDLDYLCGTYMTRTLHDEELDALTNQIHNQITSEEIYLHELTPIGVKITEIHSNAEVLGTNRPVWCHLIIVANRENGRSNVLGSWQRTGAAAALFRG